MQTKRNNQEEAVKVIAKSNMNAAKAKLPKGYYLLMMAILELDVEKTA